MLELPEASNVAKQLNATIKNKRVSGVAAGHTPHKLAWYYGDRDAYRSILVGKVIGKTIGCGSMVEIAAGAANILLGEGVGIRFHARGQSLPPRHQLLIEFEDGSALTACVQMYGGMGCFLNGKLDNPYYRAAKEKPSPLTAKFTESYFLKMISSEDLQNASLKALVATEQRIPGLGNGTLQDILFQAKLHPKRKTRTLSEGDRIRLFRSIKETLAQMEEEGGRDIELNLFGAPGGYRTILSKKTVGKPCPVCKTSIKKETYMGGTIYYCERCQV